MTTSKQLLLPILTLCVIGILGTVVAFPALAEEVTADVVQVTTPTYRPEVPEFHPRLGTYTYEVSWQGIPAAEVQVKVTQEGLKYEIGTSVRTYSAIDLFYKLRYSATGAISAVDLMPIKTTIEQRENSRKKFTEIEFLGNGEIRSLRRTGDKEPQEMHFNSGNFTLDPFSAAFLARSLQWQVGDTREFDTFNGKSRYLITLKCKDKETIDVDGEEQEVFVIEPSVKNLTNPKSDSKLRQARIYVTTDANRDVIKIASSVFVGTVTTKLESFEPSKRLPETSVAQDKRPNLSF